MTQNQLNNSLSVLLCSVFIMISSMTLGMRPVNQVDIISAADTRSHSLILAEKDQTAAREKAQTENDDRTQEIEPETGPETDGKDPSAKSKTAPLKSFRPSEEIAAEQAVDFPVDI